MKGWEMGGSFKNHSCAATAKLRLIDLEKELRELADFISSRKVIEDFERFSIGEKYYDCRKKRACLLDLKKAKETLLRLVKLIKDAESDIHQIN